MSDNKLPTIKQLSEMTVSESDKNSALNVLLNQPPPQQFVAQHPMTKGYYIPIEKIEFLLTKIFGEWSVEIKDYQLIANSVAVTVRLHYVDPISGDKLFQDGIGACPLQTNQGASATDFTAIKSASVQMALPSAESYAVKDACEKIGAIFGKDLGRKSTSNYDGMMPEDVKNYTFDNPQLTEK